MASLSLRMNFKRLAAAPAGRATTRVPRGFSLGSHRLSKDPGFSPGGMLFICAASILAITSPARAQTAPCGLTSMTETAIPHYPPIARIAQVQDDVVLMVAFAQSGKVEHLRVISGNVILQAAAIAYVEGWKANTFTGPRECPIVIRFRLDRDSTDLDAHAVRSDLQHVALHSAFPEPMYSDSH